MKKTRLVKEQPLAKVVASKAQRYENFIREVIRNEELWALRKGDDWSICEEPYGVVYYLWSDRSTAARVAKFKFKDYRPERVELHDFMEEWLPEMIEDKVKTGVNMLNDIEDVSVDSQVLLNHLIAEDKKYQ